MGFAGCTVITAVYGRLGLDVRVIICQLSIIEGPSCIRVIDVTKRAIWLA